MTLHIGVDSTDSATRGMCTTYLGAYLMELLEREHGLNIERFPELVRLNPNVPWKTRGNGAVCLRFETEEDMIDDVFRTCEAAVQAFSVLEDPQTNPGLAVLQGDVTGSLNDLYHRALHRILTVDDAVAAADGLEIRSRGWKNSMGLIGALSAIGADLDGAHTYEAILYRSIDSKARARDVDKGSIKEASERFPTTFFNVDEHGKPVCIPRSPCPVILGVRSMTPSGALGAAKHIMAQGVERWVLWRTNQHTDAHIENVGSLEGAIPFSSITVDVTVSSYPAYTDGGHLMFEVRDQSGSVIPCFAYEPTKTFRKAIAGLLPGDEVRLWAAVRPESPEGPRSLNLEKLEVLSMVERKVHRNPRCPLCGGRTESMGRGQGLRCRSCGNRDPQLARTEIVLDRAMSVGPIEPPMCAWRHLFRPFTLPMQGEEVFEGPFWGLGRPL